MKIITTPTPDSDWMQDLIKEIEQSEQQLEVFKKLAMFNKEEAEKYHNRFKEAVEVIEELYDIVVGHIEEGDKLDSFTLQPAKQFLAKCKSLENNVTEN